MRNGLIVTVLLICYETGYGSLIQKPQDSVAVIGKTTYFNCSTSEPSKRILWYHYDVDDVQREAIYLCDNFTEYWYPCYRNGRYVIERNPATVERNPATGAYNLVIPTVVLSDSGRFQCEVDGDEGFASLTVRGAVETSATCVASEICQPYIAAIICIFLIILPTAIAGAIFVFWYLYVCRPKKVKGKAIKGDETEEKATIRSLIPSSQVIQEDETEEEVTSHSLVDSQENKSDEPTQKMVDINLSPLEEQQLMMATNHEMTKIKQLTTENDQQAIRIKELENELKCKANEAGSYAKKLNRMSDEIENLKKQNKKSENKISQLKVMVKDFEQCIYPTANIHYSQNPTLAHTIGLITDAEGKEKRKSINGMTILCKELFVSLENSSIIQVYDSETFQLVTNWIITEMSHPMDIASCITFNCIYVIHQDDNALESQILKVQPKRKLIALWSTGGTNGRLSTYQSNVIVCLFEKQLIKEYSGDGNLVHSVRLSQAVGFNHPWHAIKVTRSHFVVCHGDAKDELHRVCIVDVQGNIIKELREWKSTFNDEMFNVPKCLLADSERSVFVADRDNQKVRLLNCFLKHQKNLIKKERGLDGYPVRICLDEEKGRLFVAVNTLRSNKKDWKDGRILIFNIK